MPARITKAATLALYEGNGDARTTKAAVLVLAAVAHPVYVTKSAVLALVGGSCITHLCQCWKIARRDGLSFHFTTHNEPVALFGTEYNPCDSLSATAFESGIVSTKSGSGGDVEINGIISATGISEHDMAHGLFDGAEVTVYQTSWNPENTVGGKLLARGIITECKQGPAGYSATISTLAIKLQQTPLIDVYSPQCRHELGQGLCPVVLSGYEHAGTVSGTVSPQPMYRNNHRQFFDSSISATDGYYNGGRVTWVTGNNAGISSEVKNYYSANDLISLWDIMPFPIEITDTFTMTPGCAKTLADHQTKFSLDEESFGGQPGLPGNDYLMRTP